MKADLPQDQAALWAKVAKPDQVFECQACGWKGKPELEMTRYHLRAFCRQPACEAYIGGAISQVPPDQSIEAQRHHYSELVAERARHNYKASYPTTAFFRRYHFWPTAAVTRQEVKQ